MACVSHPLSPTLFKWPPTDAPKTKLPFIHRPPPKSVQLSGLCDSQMCLTPTQNVGRGLPHCQILPQVEPVFGSPAPPALEASVP